MRTPAKRGALSIYPAQQYAAANGVTAPNLVADLQSLALKQQRGFDPSAQVAIRAALPLKRTIELSDGDLVLINTGRFHGVEPYGDSDASSGEGRDGDASAASSTIRLSGQCWISYVRGKALRMWV